MSTNTAAVVIHRRSSRNRRGDQWVDVGTATGCRWGGRHFALRQNDGHIYYRTVKYAFMHVGNGGLGVRLVYKEDVGCASVGAVCVAS